MPKTEKQIIYQWKKNKKPFRPTSKTHWDKTRWGEKGFAWWNSSQETHNLKKLKNIQPKKP